MNIHKIKYSSNAYPHKLRQIASPPKQLFSVGNSTLLEKEDGPWVAIVGSRTPTDYGLQVTYQIASELAAAGVIIVSGLAYGIDKQAHKAAIDQGMPTVAVQANGLHEINPKPNRPIALNILKYKGLLLSEQPPGAPAYKGLFVARNRIIAGLSDAVLITEAAEGSGALHTANYARETDRTVMAIPGNITSPKSSGTNNLIRNGALAVTSASDILHELGKYTGLTSKPIRANSPEEAKLIELLKSGVSHSEELIARSNMSASEFANLMSLMEISGKVHNLGAGRWVIRS